MKKLFSSKNVPSYTTSIKAICSLSLYILPFMVSAQYGAPEGSQYYQSSCSSAVANLQGLIGLVTCFLGPVVTLLISLSVVFFLWKGYQFMRAEGDDRTEYRKAMLWGIVGIAVMVSLWGLANILINAFGLGGTTIQNIPKINVNL